MTVKISQRTEKFYSKNTKKLTKYVQFLTIEKGQKCARTTVVSCKLQAVVKTYSCYIYKTIN